VGLDRLHTATCRSPEFRLSTTDHGVVEAVLDRSMATRSDIGRTITVAEACKGGVCHYGTAAGGGWQFYDIAVRDGRPWPPHPPGDMDLRLPCGGQSGVIVLPILVGTGVDEQAAAVTQKAYSLKVGGFAVLAQPAVVDVTADRVWTFRGVRLWGYAFNALIRKTYQRYLP
jgi:hypothetical protein